MKLEMLNCTFSFSTNIVSVNHNASKQINVKFLGKSLSKSSLWCGEWLWSHDISCCLSPRRQPPVTSSDRGPGSVDLGTSPCNLSCISGHRAHSIYQETGDCDANKVMPIKKTLVPLSSLLPVGPWLLQTFYKTVECAMLGADSLDTADAKLSLVTPITGGVTSARRFYS